MTEDKPIMIDGVEFYKQTDINRGLDEEHYVIEFHLLATHYNLLLEEYARKTQECQQLINKNNRLEEKLNATELLLEGKNNQYTAKTWECGELKERLNSKCFDPKSNNNRCISYNRIAEDYERDLKQLDQLKAEKEELQYQLRCVTGREKGYRKNSDFWEKRYEKLKEQFFQLKAENEKLKNIIQKSANSFCNDYVEAIENYDKLKEELTHIQHNCTREGCKYYDNEDYKVFYRCKAEQKLERIKEFATALCYTVMSDGVVTLQKDILQIIDEVK